MGDDDLHVMKTLPGHRDSTHEQLEHPLKPRDIENTISGHCIGKINILKNHSSGSGQIIIFTNLDFPEVR